MFGGKPIGVIEVTEKPYKERTSKMTESEYESEGFAFLSENKLEFRGQDPRQAFTKWKNKDASQTALTNNYNSKKTETPSNHEK